MIRITPAARISFSLVMITVSLLLMANMMGFAPDRAKIIMESRRNLCESLALQFSFAADRGDIASIKNTMRILVERDDSILSTALRTKDGQLLASSGDHFKYWKPPEEGKSSLTHIQVPIFKGQSQWATVEIVFTKLWLNNLLSFLKNSYVGLLAFVGIAGLGSYFFFIKRTLRELDPSAVVPERVKAAFDVFEEGVMLLDEKEQVVMCNVAFAEKVGKSQEALVGYRASEFRWVERRAEKDIEQLPWMKVIRDGKSRIGVPLSLETEEKGVLKFIINASPILDGKGKGRGVLVTCDDVTELDKKNTELNTMVTDLKSSHDVIQNKNKELEFLATHDPMTRLLNRRALNQQFAVLFDKATKDGTELSCIMTDIDHFKAVNDNHGHAVGDKVIITMSNILMANSRESDLTGRYGGEEFVLVFPGMTLAQAAEVAERIRKEVKADTTSGVPITISLGVSSLKQNPKDPQDMTDQSDKALYIAKESGRNRVICWGDETVLDIADMEKKESEPEEKEKEKEKEEVPKPAPEIKVSSAISAGSEIVQLQDRIVELEGEAVKQSAELEYSETYDQLTGLPTRALFDDRITIALARGHRYDSIVSVLSASIDSISRISDLLGHQVADELIVACGQRLLTALRAIDTVALLNETDKKLTVSRIGQEEFGILLTDIQQVDSITWIAKRILDSFTKPFAIQDNEIYVTMNIGISIYPYDGETSRDLQQSAAAARHHAKNVLGQNTFHFYFDDINQASIKQIQLEGQLHSAIKNDEFLLYYQSKVDVASGDIVGMEALIRWQNPKSGFMMPNSFIEVAEHSGVIGPIGDWVLSTACLQAQTWRKAGMKDFSVSINFSTKQFRSKDIVEKIRDVLEGSGLPPEFLEIEVTERSMMEDMEASIATLKQIRDLGVDISVDDFGTGYSSLSYLKKLPVTHIKIDRSFIADIESNENDKVLVKSIIDMAHALGLKVVAEGIETEPQLEVLRGFACDQAQGYFFTRPVPAKDLTQLLPIEF